MKHRRVRLDSIDRSILRFMIIHGGWMTTNFIADRVEISWVTADIHIEQLARAGYVMEGKKKDKLFYRVNEKKDLHHNLWKHEL